jgi:hypothetical protein
VDAASSGKVVVGVTGDWVARPTVVGFAAEQDRRGSLDLSAAG